jgi:hypothetical protein
MCLNDLKNFVFFREFKKVYPKKLKVIFGVFEHHLLRMSFGGLENVKNTKVQYLIRTFKCQKIF